MSTDAFTSGRRAGPAPGALLLCRAEPQSVAPVARLLRERAVLAPAGEVWSVLVPEGRPWLHDDEPVDRVVTGWSTALAVAAPWPVLALWWDADRAGCLLASGSRRPVGCTWLTGGTPAGEEEALRAFAGRLGLGSAPDLRSLDRLTAPDPAFDARARMRALLAVLTRVGVRLPAGLDPGESAERLREAAGQDPAARPLGPGPERGAARAGRDTARAGGPGPWLPWLPWGSGPRTRALALSQVAAGLPLLARGLRRRSGGWTVAGALLLTHGALGLVYDLAHPRD
ncbi:hypothetical protein ACIF8T_31375 [Streptomyces sp. NPDC085946]|uniref:hypothetical protein n=1 Tax=Streptomyces sp. NPDC085946 TaxID=3365744 RepID=UPI0037D1902A